MRIRNVVLIMSALVLSLAGCKNGSEAPQSRAVKYVKVASLDSGVSQRKMVLNGKIKEKSLTSLSFRVGGPLAKLNVKQGDYVRAGQVIAQIDKRDYELQVATNKARFTQVEAEYQRYKVLVEQNKIPKNTFEQVESGYLMAKTALENAQNQLRDTELKAPISGYVYEKFVENFQTVGPGTPIVSVIDNSKLEVVVAVSEGQLNKVTSDRESLLTVDNAGVNNLPVSLKSISEKAMSDGLYEVKFEFANTKDLKIAPGMTAEVNMLCDNQSAALTVASSALFHEDNTTFVWVFNASDNKVHKRAIQINLDGAQGEAKVVSGLKAGEKIVVAGVNYLIDGQEVKPIEVASETNVGGLL